MSQDPKAPAQCGKCKRVVYRKDLGAGGLCVLCQPAATKKAEPMAPTAAKD